MAMRNIKNVELRLGLKCLLRIARNSNSIFTCRNSTISEKLENIELKQNDVTDKIIYSSVIESKKVKLGFVRNKILENKITKQIEFQKFQEKHIKPFPVSLKYITDVVNEEQIKEDTEETIENEEKFHLPFSTPDYVENNTIEQLNEEQQLHNEIKDNYDIVPDNWMSDYEVYPEQEAEGEMESWKFNYGTPNPNSKISNIPCGGCGALLHCKDTSIPGYVPSEIYVNATKDELKTLICQRCHFLKNYEIALQVRVSPEDYPKIIETIKTKFALTILMVDLLDFPCSIWPNILDIIGKKRPVIIVGNKVDLLPQDSKGYLNHIKKVLEKSIQNSVVSEANIKHIALISAKTGYGVEELITKLHNLWQYKGDVYLIGCTNVGKSTLFNALLQSDYCKIQAVDLIQRATTSLWPGTTLNLLKFPILRPSGWRLHIRTQRLIAARTKVLPSNSNSGNASLIGHIGRTFMPETPVESSDPFSVGVKGVGLDPKVGFNERAKEYKESRWCYDTPGVVHPDQFLHHLTTEELMLTLPKKLICPQTFYIYPEMTVLIGGLSRIDYTHGQNPLRLTFFISDQLPITICKTMDADLLYDKLLGGEILGVPRGNEERLSKWPRLKSVDNIEVIGKEKNVSCADIVLSSAGWVSVTLKPNDRCRFQAWTPEGRGIYLRTPPLLPFAVNLKGKRIRGTPAYRNNYTFKQI